MVPFLFVCIVGMFSDFIVAENAQIKTKCKYLYIMCNDNALKWGFLLVKC